MSEFLLNYKRVDPTTWVYLSSLLSLGLFFKFNRFWSVRNLDLILLILLAPGLLLVHNGRVEQRKVIELTGSDFPGPVETLIDQMNAAAKTGLTEDEKLALDEAMVPRPVPEDLDGFLQRVEQYENMQRVELVGFIWLLIIAGLLVVRLLIDPNMVRRPLLEPNLTTGGLIFLCVSSFVFLMANVVASAPAKQPVSSVIVRRMLEDNIIQAPLESQRRPGYALLALFPEIPTTPLTAPDLPKAAADIEPSDSKLDDDKLDGPDTAAPPIEPAATTANGLQEATDGPLARNDEAPRADGAIGGEGFNPQEGQESQIANSRAPVDTESDPTLEQPAETEDNVLITATRFIAILSHLAIVLGIAVVGYRHFDSLKTGVGAATLYLLLPYTAQLTGYIEHSIPAALLVWAVVFYRRPATAGAFLGLAIGCYYYPLFLLPLWISFYWQRGLGRFMAGVFSMLALLVALLWFKSGDMAQFGENMRTMFGVWTPLMEKLEGVWGLGWDPWYRVPVLALFIGTTCTLAIWPAQKNLGTLISCSGAVMVATQFWHGFGGGLYMGWYLPLLLLTIFRPNLEDRIALSVLGEGWFPRRKAA